MGGQDGYGFCPRCGAVMQEGVCRSCGYSTRRDADWQGSSAWQTGSGWQEPFHGQAQTGGQEPSLRPVKKQKKPGRSRVVAFTCVFFHIFPTFIFIQTLSGHRCPARSFLSFIIAQNQDGYTMSPPHLRKFKIPALYEAQQQITPPLPPRQHILHRLYIRQILQHISFPTIVIPP